MPQALQPRLPVGFTLDPPVEPQPAAPAGPATPAAGGGRGLPAGFKLDPPATSPASAAPAPSMSEQLANLPGMPPVRPPMALQTEQQRRANIADSPRGRMSSQAALRESTHSRKSLAPRATYDQIVESTGPLAVPIRGLDRVGEGILQTTRPGIDEKAGGVHKILSGAAQASMPVTAPLAGAALVAAPAATIGAAAGGAALQQGTERLLNSAKKHPKTAEVIGALAGPVGYGAVKLQEKFGGPGTAALAGDLTAPIGAAIGASVGQRVSVAGTKHLLGLDREVSPVRGLHQALRPTQNETNADEVFRVAKPEIQAADRELTDPAFVRNWRGAEGEYTKRVIAATDKAQRTTQQAFDQIAAPYRDRVTIPGDQIVDDALAAVPKYSGSPELGRHIESVSAAYRGKNVPMSTLERDWHAANARINNSYNRSAEGQNIQLRTDADIAFDRALAKSIRDRIVERLDQENGGAIPASLMRRLGSLIEFKNMLLRRQNAAYAADTASPIETAKHLGTALSSVARGNVRSAIPEAMRAMNFRKSLDQQLLEEFARPAAPNVIPLSPTPNQGPVALLGPGAIRMPSVPDDSGPIQAAVPQGFRILPDWEAEGKIPPSRQLSAGPPPVLPPPRVRGSAPPPGKDWMIQSSTPYAPQAPVLDADAVVEFGRANGLDYESSVKRLKEMGYRLNLPGR